MADEFTDEQHLLIVEFWAKTHGSPELIDGLLFGEVDDFLSAFWAFIGVRPDLSRQLPVHVVRRVLRLQENSTIEETITISQEVLNLPVIREALDEMTGKVEVK